MPYTEAQIANMALGHVGVQGYISSLENDKSNEARTCRTFYAHARDTILEMMSWPFATVRANLQLQGTAFDGWTYAYAYPNDCAFASAIVLPGMRTPPSDKKVPFRIVRNPTQVGKLIMTDQESAVLEYNIKITDPAEFDATFAHAVALFLATLIGGPLRVDASLLKKKEGEFQAWQAEAGTKGLREQKEDEIPESELVSVRS